MQPTGLSVSQLAGWGCVAFYLKHALIKGGHEPRALAVPAIPIG
jgi:hypothetical protein